MLTHRNPYTDTTLANEPAVAMVELVNEDSLFFWTFKQDNVPAAHWQRLEARFGEWLKHKYGSIEAAIRRWQVLHKDDGPKADLAGLYDIWHLTRDGLKHANDAKRKRLTDQTHFMTETQHGFYEQSVRYVKDELDYIGLVTASNWHTADAVTLDALERYTYTAGDVIDRHGYFSGKHEGEASSYSVRTGHTFTSKSGLRHPNDLPIQTNQIAGYPQIISELGWPQPNRYRAEMTALGAAYGALQGVDGLYFFALDNNYVRATGMSKFQVAAPDVAATFPAAALIYRRGLVREAKPAVVQKLNLDELYALKGEGIAQAQALDKLREWEGRMFSGYEDYPPTSFYVGPVVRDLPLTAAALFTPYMHPNSFVNHITDHTVRSRTDELMWNHQRGVLRIDAARAKGAVGFLKDEGPITLGGVTIRCGNEYASILLVPLDGKPIAQSSRLLMQAMTEARPYGFEASNGRIESLGAYPFNVRNIDAAVTLPAQGDATVTVLDENGYERRTVDAQREDGALRIELVPDGIYHVIER